LLSPVVNLPKDQRRLLRLYAGLNEQRRASLQAFAEFLSQQQEQNDPGSQSASQETLQPEDIPRPQEESVVAAMRRLTKTFPMIDRDALLDKATSLMTAHMLQGQPAPEVIDELEVLFHEHYEIYLKKNAE